jgi:hypothetical protein
MCLSPGELKRMVPKQKTWTLHEWSNETVKWTCEKPRSSCVCLYATLYNIALLFCARPASHDGLQPHGLIKSTIIELKATTFGSEDSAIAMTVGLHSRLPLRRALSRYEAAHLAQWHTKPTPCHKGQLLLQESATVTEHQSRNRRTFP